MLTTKKQCKNGGWRNFADDQAQPFKNQGPDVDHIAVHGLRRRAVDELCLLAIGRDDDTLGLDPIVLPEDARAPL